MRLGKLWPVSCESMPIAVGLIPQLELWEHIRHNIMSYVCEQTVIAITLNFLLNELAKIGSCVIVM